MIPAPQQVTLSGDDFEFTPTWRVELAAGVQADDKAVVSLRELLRERFHLALPEGKGKGGPILTLAIDPGAVLVGDATDRTRRRWPSRPTA